MVKTASNEAGNGQTVNVTQQRSRKVLVKTKDSGSSLVAQQSGDPELSLLWLGVLSWCGFNPWLGNFYMPQVQPEKKKKKRLRPKISGYLEISVWVPREASVYISGLVFCFAC